VNAPGEMPVEELQTLYASLSTTANKGNALENFCAVFFNAVPGIAVTGHNVQDNVQSQELDLVLDNDRDPNGLDFIKPFIFVEAKNWGTTPEGDAQRRWPGGQVRECLIAIARSLEATTTRRSRTRSCPPADRRLGRAHRSTALHRVPT